MVTDAGDVHQPYKPDDIVLRLKRFLLRPEFGQAMRILLESSPKINYANKLRSSCLFKLETLCVLLFLLLFSLLESFKIISPLKTISICTRFHRRVPQLLVRSFKNYKMSGERKPITLDYVEPSDVVKLVTKEEVKGEYYLRKQISFSLRELFQ